MSRWSKPTLRSGWYTFWNTSTLQSCTQILPWRSKFEPNCTPPMLCQW